MSNGKPVVDRILGSFLIFLMGVTVLVVLWQVASRYLFKNPSVFTDELSGFLLMWIGLLGAAYATGKKLHLAIDILPNYLPEHKGHILSVVINMIVIVFSLLVMVIGGINLMYLTLSLDQMSATLDIPLGMVYAVLPISGMLICYYSLLEILGNIKTFRHHAE